MTADWDPQTAALLRETFTEEAADHLDAIRAALPRVGGPEGEAALEQILRKFHTLKGSAATVGMDAVSAAAHAVEERLVRLRKGPRSPLSSEALEQVVTLLQRLVAAAGHPAAEGAIRRELDALLVATRGESSSDEGAARGPEPEDEPVEAKQLRVSVGQLDALMNTVGELVIDRTRVERRLEELKGLSRDLALTRARLGEALARGAATAGAPATGLSPKPPPAARLWELERELAATAASLEQTVQSLTDDAGVLHDDIRALQERLVQVRLVPIRQLHARLQRPMEALAARQGKDLRLVIDDESSGMDRAFAEPVGDALIQLVRNAVAHGIEPPAQRVAAGKAARGTIRVSARHQGDQVLIEVTDDGAGIDRLALRRVLATRGQHAVGAGAQGAGAPAQADHQLLDAIFEPGLSTRAAADELAGRGMGLDIVRRNIVALGGNIQVASRPGQGTTFTLHLPLTSAIARALLFKVSGYTYALPVPHVQETLSVAPNELEQTEDGWRVSVRGQRLPLVRLEPLLGQGAPRPRSSPEAGTSAPRQPVVVVRFGHRQFAVSCSRVIGPREIVLKRLGPLLATHPLLAGATVSGSGKVQLILDVAALARLCEGRAQEGALLERPTDAPCRARVLVVDDSRAVREALERIFRGAGYEVELASDGREAWDALHHNRFALMVTDLEMPRLHGLELIARCQDDPELAALPIVVLSSRTSAAVRARVLDAGARAILAKPINRRVILDQLAALGLPPCA